MISLGPLLGIEGDYDYTVVLLLPSNIEKERLELCLSWEGQEHSLKIRPKCSERLKQNTLYRFEIRIEEAPKPYEVTYYVTCDGQQIPNAAKQNEWTFVVPGKDTLPKVGFASCNGEHDRMPCELDDDHYDMWNKLWDHHKLEKLNYSFHCLLLCGDQIYADPIFSRICYFRDNGLLGWRSRKKFAAHKIDPNDRAKLIDEIENFYERLYISSWSKAPVSQVLASIPSAMMWDDHDIIDGWGSYPKDLLDCEIFQLIFPIAKRYFELLQIRTRNNRSLISETHFTQHFSFRNYAVLLLDNRSFRRDGRIMSDEQYCELCRINKLDLFSKCPEALGPVDKLLPVTATQGLARSRSKDDRHASYI